MRDSIGRWFVSRALVLSLALAVVGCMQAANVATRTVTSIGAAELVVASAGKDAYLAELAKLTAENEAKRASVGCTPRAECTMPGWAEYKAEAAEKLAAAKKRYETFRLAMITVDAALVETAIAIRVYLDTGGGFDLAAVLGSLMKAWATASALLSEYGIKAPDILTGGGK